MPIINQYTQLQNIGTDKGLYALYCELSLCDRNVLMGESQVRVDEDQAYIVDVSVVGLLTS